MRVFIDSNLPMYMAGREHALRGPSRSFLAGVGTGEIEGVTSVEVLREILHRYSAIGQVRGGCEVYSDFVNLCPAVLPVTLAETDRARDLLCSVPGISARDALHAAVMLNHDLEWIATFDRDFDRIPGIRRFQLP